MRSRVGLRSQGLTSKSSAAHYRVQITFQAPLPFVYRWCTNYSTEDGRYSGEGYQRRITRRTATRVEMEDLYDTGGRWIWIHRDVRLHPPNKWHAESIGSDRALVVDYRLSRGRGDGTMLSIRASRQPFGIGRKNPPKSVWERNVTRSWASFARALEKDYAQFRRRGARAKRAK